MNQVIAIRLLEKRGHKVVGVGDGREAVAAAENQNFDPALVDLQMPEMDGLQAVGLIRQHEEETGSGRLPIIALTTHAMRGDRERCLAAGMDGYITKPINRTELFTAIDSVLQSCHPAGASLLPSTARQIPVGEPLSGAPGPS